MKEENKNKKNIVKTIFNVVFWVFLAVLIGLAVIAFINFSKVQSGEEPSMYSSKEEYTEEDSFVTVYNYYVFKIVDVDTDSKNAVSLKLWFFDDLK